MTPSPHLSQHFPTRIKQPTINGSATGTATTTYVHTDHLNSTALMTNASGTVVQTLDYYPYGGQRISQSTNGADAKRRFIGEVTDPSGLDYLNARYYDPTRGQFLKQDPVFWELGITKDGQSALTNPQAMNSGRTGGLNSGFASGWRGNTQSRAGSISRSEYLADPQMQNSYGYARNNPINMKDPDGLWGVFVQGDASANAGMGAGFAGSASAGAGVTWDWGNSGLQSAEFGSYGSYGGLVGGALNSTTVEGTNNGPNPYSVFGLSGGLSRGITLTNATKISQLALPTVTNSVTAGIATFSWSRDPQSGIWTVTMSIGAKPGLSFSSYPTVTKTTTAQSAQKKPDSAKKTP